MIRSALADELKAIKHGKTLFSDMAHNEDIYWSAPFSIEDLEDF